MPRKLLPGGILIRCPGDFNCLLWVWRSSDCTLSPSWMTKLFILCLRLSAATLWVISLKSEVANDKWLFSKVHDHIWGKGWRLTSKLSALLLNLALFSPQQTSTVRCTNPTPLSPHWWTSSSFSSIFKNENKWHKRKHLMDNQTTL